MSKFWYIVGTVFAAALVLVVSAPDSQNKDIDFTDLETECRYDRGQEAVIQLNRDRTLSFSGHFKVDNPESKMRYDYRKTSDRVVLNVKSSRLSAPSWLWSNCLGLGVYEGRTTPFKEGVYHVTLKHEGEVVEEQVIDIE